LVDFGLTLCTVVLYIPKHYKWCYCILFLSTLWCLVHINIRILSNITGKHVHQSYLFGLIFGSVVNTGYWMFVWFY
jgi:hypothetical protein